MRKKNFHVDKWIFWIDQAYLSRSHNLKHLEIIFDGNICQMYTFLVS